MEKFNTLIGRLTIAVLALGISAYNGPGPKTKRYSSQKLQKNLDLLLEWFPGEYDNHEQVYQEAVDKLPLEKRHRQTHHIFYEVNLDFIPGRTLYAQQSQHYDRN